MPDQRVVQQVYGILSMNKINFAQSDDQKSFMAGFGSAAVFIDFRDWYEDGTLVHVHAPVLEQVDSSGDRKLQILEELNEVNKSTFMGKVYLDADAGTIVLEHDILGDHLDDDEFMSALRVVASMADDLDDKLREKLGTGRRAHEAWAEAQGEGKTEDGTGPVVQA
jgi:hypothetical protein